MTDSDEVRLIERLRRRDESALADLYDRMGRRAFGLAYRVLGDASAAEDVVQAAFVTIWEQADRLSVERGSAEGLLLTVVHRRAVDAVRARARTAARTMPLAIDPVDEDEAPLDAMIAADRAADVREALRSLPEAQRSVVLQAYFEGITQQEIARRDRIPLGTVKSRLRLAMEHLRNTLGDG